MRMLACLLLACLAACSSTAPEQRLRERIAAMQAAIQAGRAGDFMAAVAEDFVGEGGMDRRQLRGMIAAQLLRQKEIGVSVVSMDVRMLPGERQAEVELDVLLTGGAGFLPDRASTHHIHSGWNDGDKGWQVISADW